MSHPSNQSSSSPASPAQFFSRAVDLGFLSREQHESLITESLTRGLSPASYALNRGLLTFEQIEIIETLLRPHEVAPGYEVLDLLGYGGMGAVYRARQLALDRPVALKTILLNSARGPNAMRRFEREAVTIGRLVHPHIVTAYDFGRHAGRLYLAMELVQGQDAETWLESRDSVTEFVAWHVARQAAAGLAYAAAQGVVHRDIKPANLLLVPAPAGSSLPPGIPLVKIADFGLAVLHESDENQPRLTTQGTAVGSPNYMPPEQIDAGSIDHRSDIYALGATLFHIFAGQPPWRNLTLTQILGKKLSGDVPSLAKIRPDLSTASLALVSGMMALSPDDRPADYETLLRRIDGLLADLQPVGTTAFPAQRTGRATSNSCETATGLETNDRLGAALPKTTQFSRTIPPRRKFFLLAAGVIGGLALALGGVFAFRHFQQGTANLRDCRPDGPPLALFNGKSLEPPQWQLISGQWSPEVSEENGYVLTGTSGSTIARRFTDITPFSAHYQFQCLAQLNTASAVELQFDVPRDRSQPRWVVRLEQGNVRVGRAASERASPSSFTFAQAIDNGEHPRAIAVERHTTRWWILLDEQPLCSVPPLNADPLPEVHLRSIGGTANFFDLTLTPLARQE